MLDELNEYVSEDKANEINSSIKEAIRKEVGMKAKQAADIVFQEINFTNIKAPQIAEKRTII